MGYGGYQACTEILTLSDTRDLEERTGTKGNGALAEGVSAFCSTGQSPRMETHSLTGMTDEPYVLAFPSSMCRCCQSSQACPSSWAKIYRRRVTGSRFRI